VLLSVAGPCPHLQRMQHNRLGPLQPFKQAVFTKFIHQKPDRAQIHAEYRRSLAHVFVQGCQHETIAAQGDNQIRFIGSNIIVAVDQYFARTNSVFMIVGNDCDSLEIHHSALELSAIGGCGNLRAIG